MRKQTRLWETFRCSLFLDIISVTIDKWNAKFLRVETLKHFHSDTSDRINRIPSRYLGIKILVQVNVRIEMRELAICFNVNLRRSLSEFRLINRQWKLSDEFPVHVKCSRCAKRTWRLQKLLIKFHSSHFLILYAINRTLRLLSCLFHRFTVFHEFY